MALVRILGIDPGLRHTGWGVIEAEGSRLAYVASGAVHTETGENFAERLRMLHEGLAAVIAASSARRGGGRGDFCQPRPAIGAQARPCARHRVGRAGAGRARSQRICRQSGEKDRGRRGPRRKGADRHDGQGAAAAQRGARPPTPPTPWRWPSATPSIAGPESAAAALWPENNIHPLFAATEISLELTRKRIGRTR